MDVNGDGWNDILVGVNGYGNWGSDIGMAVLFFGSANGFGNPDTLNGFQWGGRFGSSLTLCDLNSDAYADAVIGAGGGSDAFIYMGSPNGLRGPVDQVNSVGALGIAMNNAGDMNNDSFDEVLIGAPYYTNKGAALVYSGNKSLNIPSPEKDFSNVFFYQCSPECISMHSSENHNKPWKINVYSINGSLVQSVNIKIVEGENRCFSGLKNGIYIITVNHEFGFYSQKIIVN